jgi:hypothetical protein
MRIIPLNILKLLVSKLPLNESCGNFTLKQTIKRTQ